MWLLDGFFDILNSIWQYRFFDNEYVNKIFSGAIIVAGSWLIVKVMIELIMNHIVKNDGRDSPLSIYKGIIIAIVMMFLITPLFSFGHQVSTSLTNAVITTSGMDKSQNKNEGTISKALVRAMVYENEMDAKDIDNLVKNWKTIDITKKEGGFAGIGDVYKYSVNLFMLVVVSILTIFLLFFVAIQMAKRVMELALFKIIGPFCCTGLTNSHSNSFQTWTKSAMGLFLITVVQYVSLGLMINMFGSAISENGTMAGLFLMIGALLFIISTPTIVSSLLGQQSGLMTGFGDIQSMMAMGMGVKAGIGVASGALASGVSVVPKGAGYISGLGQQFQNYKSEGSSNLGAFGKTAFSEATRPFTSAYQKMANHYNGAKTTESSPFRFNTSNPYQNPHSIQFNPIRNQYQEQSGNDLNNGRWY